MATIPLTGGGITVVDDADLGWLSRHAWRAHLAHTGAYYAAAHFPRKGGAGVSTRQMQRVILDPGWLLPRSTLVDHINGDTLDNRRDNLRLAGYSLSNLNRSLPTKNTTGYRWVFRNKLTGKYYVQVRNNAPDGSRILRTAGRHFATAKEAALAANEIAWRAFGPDAVLNEVESDDYQ